MGATITTFCNAASVFLYTELSVAAPYYWEDLAPGECKENTVGRVWFTATANISEKAGDLYFPISKSQAAGLLSQDGLKRLDFVNMTASESDQITISPADFVIEDIQSVSSAYYKAKENLFVSMTGYYANKNKVITITGGPRAAVHKEHPHHPGKFISIIPATFDSLKMNVR